MRHFWLPSPPERPPRRIVSLVPSLTELFCLTLGDAASVVGRTSWCNHPEHLTSGILVFGGTRSLRVQEIIAAQPDLVVAGREENPKDDIEQIAVHSTVLVTDVTGIADFDDLLHCCAMTFPDAAARFQRLRRLCAGAQRASQVLAPPPEPVAYLIWRKPWMVAGGDTFIHATLKTVGYRNVFADRTRYPAVSADDLRRSGARTLLLSSEPFPFSDAHARELEEQTGLPTQPIDGRRASWYSATTPGSWLHLLRERLRRAENGTASDEWKPT